jgi:hypothetical protein
VPNPGVIKEIWQRISANPDTPVAAIDAVAVAHGKSLSTLLPEFWKANYLLAYNDAIGSGASDIETVWRPRLQNDPDPATHGDQLGPARPARQHVDLTDGALASGDVTVDRGGARYVELQPHLAGVYGDFAISISGVARPDLQVRAITITYPSGNPQAATICTDQPVALQNGSGSASVPLTPDCSYLLLMFASTDALGSGDSAHWTTTFTRKTVVTTNSQWKTLELSWSGGTTNPEPGGWQNVGFADSTWSAAYIPTDPYFSWVDIPDADWLSSTGRSTSHLQSEVWIARYEFAIAGSVPSDATMQWNVDNTASIWINGTQLVTNGGTWSTIISTTIPKALLHSGTNSIAVKVFQDSNTNTWAVNPTFFQTYVTIPTQ